MRIEASDDVAAFIRRHGGSLYVWAEQMRYGSGRVFVLDAATESPGPDREFARFAGPDYDVLFDPGGRDLPDRLLLTLKGRRRKQVRAYWNGNSFGQD